MTLQNNNETAYSNVLSVAEKIQIKPSQLTIVLKNTKKHYRTIRLLKRSGKEYRAISAPSLELKDIQRNILDLILKDIPLLPCIYGFSRNKTIVENARKHAVNSHLLNVDIVNFFPSIHYSKINSIFESLGLNSTESKLLTKLTTLDGSLPQGAPTSPILASLALRHLDSRLKDLCRRNRLTYTRYFDDISISGTNRISKVINKILLIISSEGYKVHFSKEKFQLFTPEMVKVVTGIHIDTKGKLSVPNIKEIEEYLINIQINGLGSLLSDNPTKEKDVLRGKIAFISQVDKPKGIGLKTVFDRIGWE